ncbi:MAG: hypothetical protein CMJ75_18930 [Planctomycetaceae bacterium]|nr:hypothetical protein [Planctomycetaceae bacterium]
MADSTKTETVKTTAIAFLLAVLGWLGYEAATDGPDIPDGAIVVTDPEIVAILELDEWVAITNPEEIAAIENGWATFYPSRKHAGVARTAVWIFDNPERDTFSTIGWDEMNSIWRISDDLDIPTDTYPMGEDRWFVTLADQPIGILEVR